MKQIDGYNVPDIAVKGTQNDYCKKSQQYNACSKISCSECIFNMDLQNKEAFKKWLKEQGE